MQPNSVLAAVDIHRDLEVDRAAAQAGLADHNLVVEALPVAEIAAAAVDSPAAAVDSPVAAVDIHLASKKKLNSSDDLSLANHHLTLPSQTFTPPSTLWLRLLITALITSLWLGLLIAASGDPSLLVTATAQLTPCKASLAVEAAIGKMSFCQN